MSPFQQKPENPGNKADDIYRKGGALNYYGKRNGADLEHGLDADTEFNPNDQIIRKELDKVKNTTERKKLQEKVEQGKPLPKAVRKELEEKDREAFRSRILEEFYGGNEKLRQAYLDAVREAIEIMGDDALHQFIKEHLSYNSGNYKAWGNDFMELVNLPDDSDVADLPDRRRERVVVALQSLMVDEFDTDMFQLHAETDKGLRINPLIRIDGKLGGYTVSVLSAYWQREYGEKSKNKPNPLGLAKLERGNQKMFANAMDYLNAQLGKVKKEDLDARVARGIYDPKKTEGKSIERKKPASKERKETTKRVMSANIEVDTYLLPWAKQLMKQSRQDLETTREIVKEALNESPEGRDLSGLRIERTVLEGEVKKAENRLAYYKNWVRTFEAESARLKKNPDASSKIKNRHIALDTFMIPNLKRRLRQAKEEIRIAGVIKKNLKREAETKREMLRIAEEKEALIRKKTNEIKNLKRYLKHYEAESSALKKEKLA